MTAGAAARYPARHQLAWHRAECWGYDADLDLWRQLAGPRPRRILDLGSGSGRVATDLARQGHSVTGLDYDPVLIEALGEAVPGVEAVLADLRDFDLGRRFDLILAPMQTLQLLADQAERAACLARVRRHLEADGIFAAAMVELAGDVPTGDLLRGQAPVTDFDDRDPGLLAASTTTALIHDDSDRLRIRRRRQVYLGEGAPATDRHDVEFELALLGRDRVETEFAEAHLSLLEWRAIPATDSHMGAVVAIGRAACQSA